MANLPPGINTHIFRFLSHPVADAIRDRVTEAQSFGLSDLHTFYIFFFLQRKLNAFPEILEEMHDRMEIDSYYFRPGLWELYESQLPGYDLQHYFVDTNRVAFRSSNIICYRI